MEGLSLVRPLCCSNVSSVVPPRARPFLPPFRLLRQLRVPSSSRFRSVGSVVCSASNDQLSQSVEADSSEWAMQDFYSLRREVEAASARVEDIRASAGLQQLEKELADLELKASDASFWDDRAKAQQTLLALTDVKDKIRLLSDFKTQVEEAETVVMLTEEMDSKDTGLLEEAAGIIKELNKALDRFELTELLSGPYDKEGAVVSITAGAGGTDAQCRIGLTCFSGCMRDGERNRDIKQELLRNPWERKLGSSQQLLKWKGAMHMDIYPVRRGLTGSSDSLHSMQKVFVRLAFLVLKSCLFFLKNL